MALRFDASTDQLSRTTNLPTITAWTIMAWVYISVDPNNYTCFWQFGQSTGSAYYYLGTDAAAAGAGRYLSYNSAGELQGTSLNVTTWYHMAQTCAGTGANQLLSYLNGVLDISHSGSTGPTAQVIRLANDNLSEAHNGRLAAVKIYSAALPVADIANEMLTYLPQRWTNLNSWYPCVDGTVANNALDLSGAGANMTVGGTLTVEDGPPIAWGITPAWQWGRPSSVSPPPATSRPPRLHPWRFYRRVA